MINSLWFRRSCALGCYGVIILGSSVPGKQIPKFFELTPDKLIHCLEYLVFGSVILFWLLAELHQPSRSKLFFTMIILGAAGAALDELYQNLTPGRSPDFYDWCIDAVGILISIPLFKLWRRKFSVDRV